MEDNKKTPDNQKADFKSYFGISEMFTYFFRKKDPNRPVNFSLKMMHGVNKLSILIFLIGMLFFIIKKFF